MGESKIQQVFVFGWKDYISRFQPDAAQLKAAAAIMNCKSGKLGCNISICRDCGFTRIHNNSCRNRNCPNCQAVLKEVWIDQRKSEVIDTPYFHVVFTVPAELNPLIYANQRLLYGLLHKCASETLLQLSANPRHLGAVPGIIQVLHSWSQDLKFHPHIHCIVSGGGLTKDKKLRTCKKGFFIPAKVLAKKFRGKLLSFLDGHYQSGKLHLPSSCLKLQAPRAWNSFRKKLRKKTWCPDIRETFNGFGNAIEYLGRYTHRIAITNARIKKITEHTVTFTAKDNKNDGSLIDVTISNREFIRRLMMHVLPSGFQKIRYYGFLNNRGKKENLKLLFRLQGRQKFSSLLADLPIDELLKEVWGYDIRLCPACGCCSMRHAARTYALRN